LWRAVDEHGTARSGNISRSSGICCALRSTANNSQRASLHGANSPKSPKIRALLSDHSSLLTSYRLTLDKFTMPAKVVLDLLEVVKKATTALEPFEQLPRSHLPFEYVSKVHVLMPKREKCIRPLFQPKDDRVKPSEAPASIGDERASLIEIRRIGKTVCLRRLDKHLKSILDQNGCMDRNQRGSTFVWS